MSVCACVRLFCKMAVTWRAAVLEQAELVSDRLRQLASSGLLFLHNEFGLDLGLNPELWPCWAVLSAVLVGILVAVWGVAACGGAARRRRGAAPREKDTVSTTTTTETGTDNTKTPPTRAARPEEPKKKSKKKPGEKKAQPNGRPVPEPPEPREVVTVTQEVPKQTAAAPPPQPQQPPDIKADKTKKNKKKAKPEVKQSQSDSTSDGKEPDEGSWETKVSNREKRQQRKKEKGASDDSGSPGGVNHAGQQTEQPVVTAPVNTKKNKESLKVKAEKRDAIITPAPSSWNPAKSVNSGGWAEMTMKPPPQVNATESDKWSVGLKTPGHRNSEPLAWGQDSDGSWTGSDGRIKKEMNTVNFSVLGLKSSAGDPVTQSAADLGKWDGLPAVSNEWSGINGLGAVDSSSDWNAPTELWGNYEEPNMVTPAAQDAPVSQLHGYVDQLQDSDDEKEKGDPSASSKSKRKKKKKKKPEDENAVSQVNSEGLSASAENSNIKPQPHVPQEEPVKQNLMPSASQKKTDQNWEPPKQVQKKKARRET